MHHPDLPTPGNSAPYPWLVRSRDIRVLWILRILVNLGAVSGLYHVHHNGRSERIVRRLRLPVLDSSENPSKSEVQARLETSLKHLERHAGSIELPARLRTNIAFLRNQFALNKSECLILALAVCLRVDDDLHAAAELVPSRVNPAKDIARVLGTTQPRIAKALEPGGRLRWSGMIEACSGGSFETNLQLRRGGLRKLATSRIQAAEDLFGGFLKSAPPPTLTAKDYGHMSPGFDVLERLLRSALARQHDGVNILVYGAPGTGKSELARTLSQRIGVPLFDISSQSESGDPLRPGERLGSAATGLFLLGKRRAIVAFDEVEAIFNDGSDFMGKPSTAESSKAWVNRLLEQNSVPVVWIANSIRRMDPAFVRRFDLVVELEAPPQTQRLQLLERECSALLPREQLRRLSRVDCITPALVTRASKVVRRIGRPGETDRLLETVLDGVLRAQGHAPLARLLHGSEVGAFDPSLCNASEDLAALAEGVASSGAGRICLYGPPGTGKTAFGLWLADTLGKPIVQKRASDLQSPYIGVMERNLARAFEQASRDGALLQIDEIDSFLQDRRYAQRSWETSQVNEFLTQLESFDGLFIASTNLMDNLDEAALRRFDFKIRMGYLLPHQAVSLLHRSLVTCGTGPATPDDHARLRTLKLTPGDFAVVARRHRVKAFTTTASIMDALCAEAMLGRRAEARRIGFT